VALYALLGEVMVVRTILIIPVIQVTEMGGMAAMYSLVVVRLMEETAGTLTQIRTVVTHVEMAETAVEEQVVLLLMEETAATAMQLTDLAVLMEA
jgi:hypothetical protein